MKKAIVIFFIFLLLSLNINCINAIATPQSYSQGFYTLKELNLMENITYDVQNISPIYKSFIIIIDSDQNILEIVRLEPRLVKYCLRTLKFNYTIVIYGDGQLVFS